MKKFSKTIRYLLEFLAVVLVMQILKLFGIDRSANFCSYIARKIGPLLSVDKIARRNIQRILKSSNEKILDLTWDNFGRFIGEFPYINLIQEKELDKRIEIIGLENIAAFQRQEIPFILFTGHFANWDIALRITHKFYHKFAVIYRKANNPYINKLINKTRSNEGLRLIPKGAQGAKELLRSIKLGYSVIMLVDQKMNDGIEVPFLGQPSMTPNAIAKIALQFKYPLVPCQIIRTKGSYFKIILHPPLKFHQTGDDKVDCYNIMYNINETLGDWVKQHPSQWFWFHNRWGK